MARQLAGLGLESVGEELLSAFALGRETQLAARERLDLLEGLDRCVGEVGGWYCGWVGGVWMGAAVWWVGGGAWLAFGFDWWGVGVWVVEVGCSYSRSHSRPRRSRARMPHTPNAMHCNAQVVTEMLRLAEGGGGRRGHPSFSSSAAAAATAVGARLSSSSVAAGGARAGGGGALSSLASQAVGEEEEDDEMMMVMLLPHFNHFFAQLVR
jgi:hypothetical protein